MDSRVLSLYLNKDTNLAKYKAAITFHLLMYDKPKFTKLQSITVHHSEQSNRNSTSYIIIERLSQISTLLSKEETSSVHVSEFAISGWNYCIQGSLLPDFRKYIQWFKHFPIGIRILFLYISKKEIQMKMHPSSY